MAKVGWRARLGRAWRALVVGTPTEPDAKFREALGRTVDANEDQWRPLTGDPRRDLGPLTKYRMREIAYYLWRTNPLGNRTIELPLAYILAEGVRLATDDPEAQG